MWQCAFIWLIRTMVSFQCARPSHLEDQDSKSQGLSCPVGGLSSGEDRWNRATEPQPAGLPGVDSHKEPYTSMIMHILS